MPHLSPMNWLLVPIMMTFLLISLMVMMWWQFNPQFPIMTLLQQSSMMKKWYWW